jgi:hypothetical protein
MHTNGTIIQYFHWYYGNTVADPDLWELVRQNAPDLSRRGISALWLPPPYKGAAGVNDVGYGIYDLYDLGEFDLRKDGYPCVFYPDYHGAEYDDCGQHIILAPVPGLQAMIDVRKRLAYGMQRDYFDHPDLVGWTRQGDADHPGSGLVVLMSNGPGGRKWMEVGTAHAGELFRDRLGNQSGTVTINEHGWGEFNAKGGSVSVWVRA